ncbi:MAG: virulence factor [Alphaproteobacteria bacterium]|nr:virulence factor [Alphaproteobacteria bacterium]MDA7983097.1 virulence factor [Alphaproteobacteria bacterium]MDA7988850.1 virulence factor [Alphaproteobacteria bacterium]MDA8008892.1 virulence factor [Alphaproteobacteria bacterium]
MSELVVMWWRDIPAQVQARRGRERLNAHLGERFETAIDRAAMRARLTGTDGYLQEWRRESETLADDADLSQTLESRRADLESRYDAERLARLIENGGFEGDKEGV